MSAIAKTLRAVGYCWVAIVAAFAIWQGIRQVFLGAPGIMHEYLGVRFNFWWFGRFSSEQGDFDLFFALLFALPGMGLIWLGNRIIRSQTASQKTGR